jgi:ABC-2 type transport system permease protein
MLAIYAITVKELKTIARDPAGLVMLFVMPAFFIVVLSVALQGAFSSGGSGEKLDVLVVDDDGGEMGEKIVDAVEESGVFRPVPAIDDEPATRERAEEAIDQGRYRIAIVIPEGSSEAVKLEDDAAIDILVEPVLPAEFAYALKSTIQNIVSMAIISGQLTREHVKSGIYERKLAEIAARMGRADGGTSNEVDPFDDEYETQSTNYVGDRGLTVEQHYLVSSLRADNPDSVQQNVPGWTIFALFWIAQLLAMNLVQERMGGAFVRVFVSPVTMGQYILGKAVPFFVINMVQAAAMFAIGLHVLPLLGCPPLEIHNWGALALVTVAISLTSLGFGILMAAISRTDTMVATTSAALLIIMAVVGGIMVPKFVMPEFMQELAAFVPHGWALDGYLAVLIKDHGAKEVLPEVGALLAFAAAFFLFGILRMRRLSITR